MGVKIQLRLIIKTLIMITPTLVYRVKLGSIKTINGS